MRFPQQIGQYALDIRTGDSGSLDAKGRDLYNLYCLTPRMRSKRIDHQWLIDKMGDFQKATLIDHRAQIDQFDELGLIRCSYAVSDGAHRLAG
jgi:hypothetical protein